MTLEGEKETGSLYKKERDQTNWLGESCNYVVSSSIPYTCVCHSMNRCEGESFQNGGEELAQETK